MTEYLFGITTDLFVYLCLEDFRNRMTPSICLDLFYLIYFYIHYFTCDEFYVNFIDNFHYALLINKYYINISW